MPVPANTPPARPVLLRPWRRVLRIAVVLVVLFVLLDVFLVRNIGRWLVVQDPLEKGQAIVVLSGGLPVRALAAAEVYRAGWARQVWLTRSTQTAEALAPLGVSYTGEEVYDTQVLIHEGVPAQAIHVLPDPIVNTADELTEIAAALPADKSGVVIIVTSKAHARRVRALWRRLGRGRAIVRAAPGDRFEPERWWRNSGDALDVVREILGLFNTWAGLPLHGS
jgi:uncharacterized SAM-binding protein YcdF (DUF218 family)